MSNRNRPWHEELSELLSEEATSHLSRARGALARQREQREQRERRRVITEATKAQIRNDELDRELAKLAVREIEAKYAGLGGLPIAIVMAVTALAIVVFAVLNPERAGIIWAAFGFAMGAASLYGGHYKAAKLLDRLQPLAASESVVPGEVIARGKSRDAKSGSQGAAEDAGTELDDPLSRRFEEACERVDQALKNAPDQVKTFLSDQTGRTLEQLRQTGRELARRERRLRELSATTYQERIQADHDALNERLARASDESLRNSLFQAQAALKEKQAHLAQLGQGADRIEAERMRLSYTLEGLHAQILRLSATTSVGVGDPLNATVRASLEQLQGDLTALADASDEVRRMEEARISQAIVDIVDTEGPSEGGDPLTGRSRERS